MPDLSQILGRPFAATLRKPVASRADALTTFLAAMHSAGIRPLHCIVGRLVDGELVRFRAEGDKPGRANGWARFSSEPVPHGSFGSWRLGIRKSWNATDVRILSDRERRATECSIRLARAHSAAEKQRRESEVAVAASRRWLDAAPANPDHGYLLAKNMADEGLRQEGDFLIAPMRDVAGDIWNLQRVGADGRKLFLKGGRVKDLFWMPLEPKQSICIGEGVATMAAVRAATSLPVAAAMSAENLLGVAGAIHARWPAVEIIICADDDAGSEANKGMEAALEAANAVGARLAIPPRRSQDV
jgi:putative DNA primase/helicase